MDKIELLQQMLMVLLIGINYIGNLKRSFLMVYLEILGEIK
jgi:hypothetical protein